MAELGRVAQTALRSTSRLQASPIPSSPCRHVVMKGAISGRRHMSTALGVLSSANRAKSTPIPVMPPSRTQQQPYSLNWANPSRTARSDNYDPSDVEIQRPSGSSYNFVLSSSKEKEGSKGKDTASEFTTDSIGLDIGDIEHDRPGNTKAPIAPRPQMRLVPRTGRTVYVKNNVDVARSFKLLALQVGQNRIRQDVRTQKFHERPGMKRKRLKSERWQKRFRTGFKATVARVRELTKQGW